MVKADHGHCLPRSFNCSFSVSGVLCGLQASLPHKFGCICKQLLWFDVLLYCSLRYVVLCIHFGVDCFEPLILDQSVDATLWMRSLLNRSRIHSNPSDLERGSLPRCGSKIDRPRLFCVIPPVEYVLHIQLLNWYAHRKRGDSEWVITIIRFSFHHRRKHGSETLVRSGCIEPRRMVQSCCKFAP